jgi:glutathione S-transferase
MGIDFYTNTITPRCRAVAMVARHLNLQLNEIHLLPYSDTRKQEFLQVFNIFIFLNIVFIHLLTKFKINPEHTIPTIVDNGFVLWESRAIMTYLCNKYGSDSDLYPKCPMRRAIVDRMLYFDLNPLCAAAVELHFEYTVRYSKILNNHFQ